MKTYDWLKQIPSLFLQKDSKPLIGYPPPFPLEAYSSALAKLFQIQNLTVKPLNTLQLRQEQEILSGIGDKPIILSAEAVSGGTISWIIAEQDIDTLMSLLLTKQDQPLHVIDPEFKQSFYHFIALEAINTLSQVDFDKELTFRLLSQPKLPKDIALCLDIELAMENKTLLTRLILSEEFQKGLKQRYAQRTHPTALLSALDVTVHLEVGRVTLPPDNLTKLNPGDFLLLDSCALQPDGKGSVALTIQGHPVFAGIIEEGGIKIQDYSMYNEVSYDQPK